MSVPTDSVIPTICYLIGVPATGKTTLVNELKAYFLSRKPEKKVVVISEVARELCVQSKINVEDIRAGKGHAMQLQRQILEIQMEREAEVGERGDIILSDRSGIDPITFATHYGGSSWSQDLSSTEAWMYLRRRMQRALVILCEPMLEWYFHDGIRIVPKSAGEINELHDSFITLLEEQDIPFTVLPASVSEPQERLEFILCCLADFESARGRVQR